MMQFTHPHFEEPAWLWLAVLAPVLLFWLQRRAAYRRKKQLASVASPHFVAELTRSHSPLRREFKNLVLLAVTALCGLALARPQWGEVEARARSLGEDVVFALDCSRSMLATDTQPNRLQRAKMAILQFVRRQATGRVGLVAFAGGAFLQCPLTFDYDAFEDALRELDERTIPTGGTDIGRALREAFHAMENRGRRRLVVLLTDGEDLEKAGVKTAQELARQGFTIYTIGIGTAEGSELRVVNQLGQPDLVRDAKGQVVHSKLDEETLGAIAKASSGGYFALGRLGEGLMQVRKAIESTEHNASTRTRTHGIDRFHVPLGLAVALLIAESLIGTRRRIPVSPVMQPPVVVLVMLALLGTAAPVAADTSNQNVQVSAATVTNLPPPVSARGYYNAGVRKLDAGKLGEAETMFQRVLSHRNERIWPLALYNLGHVRFNQGSEELSKSPEQNLVRSRHDTADSSARNAIGTGESALASNDIDRMVEAYLRGRAARKEMRAAMDSVRQAMEAYAKTLRRWERSLGDFRGTAELQPADTNAVHNAQVVERAIAELIDRLRQMQMMMMACAGQKPKLDDVMSQLKGKIPKDRMPPGTGEDEEEEDGGWSLEDLREMQEMAGRESGEREQPLSPEEAEKLLDGFRLGGNRRLPMSPSQEPGNPKDRKLRDW